VNCKAVSPLLLLLASPVAAIPVVPNFSQGLVTSVQESKTVLKESIVSESHRTGFEYSVSGTGVEPSGGIISPSVQGTALQLSDRTSWVQTTPGAAFQFAETYQGPGLIEKVIIERETITDTIVNSTSTFSQ